MPHDSPTIDVLLRHGRFVRALARSLQSDPGAAEDLAQEASMRWLERESSPSHPWAWLRRVMRNKAASDASGAQAREARERAQARAEALPSAVEQVEEAELLHAIGAAVRALEEPYRSTILARYYSGLDARGVAKQSGTPLATVRSREQRALARLRERLDRTQGGRERWLPALGALCTRGSATALVPFWFAAACFLGSLGLWTWVLWGRAAAATEGVSVSRANAPADELVTASAGVSAPRTIGPARVERSGSGSESESMALVQESTLAVLAGRLVFADGSPAAGASVVLTGMEHWPPLGLEEWPALTVTVDEEGAFELSFTPLAAFQFYLKTESADHAAASWSWDEVRAGERKDLGEIVLYRGGAIRGRLEDGNGQPLSGAAVQGWTVRGTSLGLANAVGRTERSIAAEVDASGRFLLEGLHPGLTTLWVSTADGPIQGPNVRVAAGEEHEVSIVCHGPASETPATRNAALEFTVLAPDGQTEVRTFRVVAETLGGEPQHRISLQAMVQPRGRSPLKDGVLQGLAPGDYTLTVEAGGHVAQAHVYDLLAGETRPVTLYLEDPLEPAAGEPSVEVEPPPGTERLLSGSVLAPSGARFEGLSLALMPSTGPREGEPRTTLLAADGSFAFADAPPGDAEVFLALPRMESPSSSRIMSGPELAADWRSLGQVRPGPGEVVLDGRLSFPGTVTATVVLEGVPATAMQVVFMAEDTAGPNRAARRATAVDQGGQADPVCLFPDSWRVFVLCEGEGWVYEHQDLVDVAPGSGVSILLPLRRPPSGTITCVDADDRPMGGALLQLLDLDDRSLLTTLLRPDAEGRLTLGLSPGVYRLRSLMARGASITPAVVTWTEEGPLEAVVRF